MEIRGAAAIVTGGGTGLGGATAERLASAGARVTLLGRRLEVVSAKARALGGFAVACDIGNPPEIVRALDEAEAQHGPARIVVNAAADGRLQPTLLSDGTPSSFELFADVFRTNVFGLFYLAQQAAARMTRLAALADGIRGVILNVSSIAAADGAMGAVAYAASKGAVDALTLSMARDLGSFGIRIMTIAPGPVATEMVARDIPPEFQRFVVNNCVVSPKRMGRPEEFARLAQQIIENDFLNGSLIRFDGAMRAPYLPNGAPDATPSGKAQD